jgi:hypothetical protein
MRATGVSAMAQSAVRLMRGLSPGEMPGGTESGYRCAAMAMIICASIMAILAPIHWRGPALKGK